MASHSSILAWEIPSTEEPGYSPWGHKRLRHDLVTKQQQIWSKAPLVSPINCTLPSFPPSSLPFCHPEAPAPREGVGESC